MATTPQLPSSHGLGDSLIERLHAVHGYLPQAELQRLALAMERPLSEVMGVASFYHLFRLEPPPQHRCVVCRGTACFVRGAERLEAVLAVMGHHSYRSPALRSGTLPYLSCPRLTKREYEVLDLLASGLTDREIAERLVVSEETAKTYTKRLLKTLDVNNRLQAVLKGMRCGMVQI